MSRKKGADTPELFDTDQEDSQVMKLTDRVRQLLSNGHPWPLPEIAAALAPHVTADTIDEVRAKMAAFDGLLSDVQIGQKVREKIVRDSLSKMRSEFEPVQVEGTDDVPAHTTYRSVGASSGVTHVPLADLVIDPQVQQRKDLFHEPMAASYAESIGRLPPGVAFTDGKRTILAGGFQRYRAHQIAGQEAMAVEVRPGTLRDAIVYAVGDNATHGLRRTDADKRRAVETLLDDPEWGKLSQRELALMSGTSNGLVHKILKSRGQVDSKPKPAPETNGHAPAGAGGTSADEGEGADVPRPALPSEKPKKKKPKTDGAGVPLTAEQAEAFSRAQLHGADLDFVGPQLRAALEALALDGSCDAACDLVDTFTGTVPELLDFLREKLIPSLPYCSVCPSCALAGRADKPRKTCKVCKGRSWVSQTAWDDATEEEREAVAAYVETIDVDTL